MVIIRLSRAGAKKRPFYHVVAVDSRKPRETRVLERLGTYSPVEDGRFTLREDAFTRWVKQGAQVSDTVASLLRRKRRSAGEPDAGAASAGTAEA